jgi:hypothetical protein
MIKTKTTDKKKLCFQALQMAIDDFMAEEKKSYLFTELRLTEKIKAARTLYK